MTITVPTVSSATAATTDEAKEGRQTRFSGLVSVEKLSKTPVVIVGVGAVGRQVALGLAAMGVEPITLIDPDVVNEVNLGTQGYRPDQVGRPKVVATGGDLNAINPRYVGTLIQKRFGLSMGNLCKGAAVFCCVDDMEARRLVYETLMGDGLDEFFSEARMTSRVGHVRCCYGDDMESGGLTWSAWMADWYPNSDAETEACTSRMTPFGAAITASLMIAQYFKHLRGEYVPYHVTVNLISMEMFQRSAEDANAEKSAQPAREM